MRKELLLSLIAAGAIPASALANIDVTAQTGINDATKWQKNGLGSVAANGDLLSGGSIVVSGASAASLSFNIDVKTSKLPVGNYVIKVAGGNVKLTINGEETNKFTLTGAEETVAVKISAKTPGEYSLTGLNLEIDLDFATLQAKLNKLTLTDDGAKITDALTAITAVNYKDADDKAIEGRQYAEGLADAETAVQKKIDAMKALIAKLGNEKLETYLDKDLELWNEPSKLETDLRALLAEIDAHNANVVDKNTKSANWGANQTTKASVAADLKAAKDAVDALDLKDEFVAAQTQAALDAFNAAYNELNGRLGEFDVDGEVINKAGKQAVDEGGNPAVDEDGNPVWVYAPFDVAQLETLKTAVVAAQQTAVDDAAAYTAIQGWVNDIVKEYNSGLNEFMGLHVGNQSATWKEELTTIKDAAVAKLEDIEKIGADAKKAAAEQTKNDAISDLQNKCDEVMAAAQASDAAYAVHNATLKEAEGDLASLKDRIDALKDNAELQKVKPGIESALVTEYNTVKAALDEVRKNLDADRDEYKVSGALNITANTSAISTLEDNVTSVENTISGWKDNEDAIAKLEKDLKAAQDALVEANGKLATTLTGVAEVNLVNQFKEAYDGCEAAIKFSRDTNDNNLKEGKTDDIKFEYAENGVKEYVAKAAPTAEKFTAAVAAYKGLNDDLADLKKLVNGGIVLEGNALGDKKTYTDKWTGYEASVKKLIDGIKTAAGNKADAIYEAINAVNLNPDGVKEAIANDVDTFINTLVDGNKTALDAKAGAYSTDYNSDEAAAKYGPGLNDSENKKIENLKGKLAEYQEQINGIDVAAEKNWFKTADSKEIAMLQNASQLSSPFTCTFATWGDNQPISNLIDNNAGTFWHTEYDTGNLAALKAAGYDTANPYAQFDLGVGVNGTAKLRYAARNNDNNGCPREFTLYGCNSANGNYVALGTVAVPFDTAIKEYGSVDLKGYRYIRIVATKTKAPDVCWHAAELNLIVKHEVADMVGAYLGVNNKVVTIYNNMTTALGKLEKQCTDNVAAKKAYDESDLVKSVAGLEQWVKDNSNDPATPEWLASESYKKIVADKKALDAAIKAAYEANKLSGDSEKGKKDALSAAITNFKKAVTDNEENHNDQLKYAAQAAIDVRDAIEAASNSSYSDDVTFKFTLGEEEKELTKAEIIELLKEKQKGLQALNKQVYDDYAALNSQEDNVYGGLVVEVQAIVNAMSSAYRQAVLDANWATANTAMDGQYDRLDEAYKAAVALYNRFTAEIAGKDDYNTYVGLLKEEIDAEHGHAELQKHYQTMRELQANVDEILANALPALGEKDANKYTILSEEDFNDVKGDVVAAVQAMVDYNTDLTNAVDAFAKDYLYGKYGKFTAANTEITEAMQMMETAKMSDDQIEEVVLEAQTHVLLAQAYFAADPTEDAENDDPAFGASYGDMSDVKSGDVEKYFINMPAVLSELALVDINVEQVLTDFWKDSYADALETLAGYQARYNEAAKGALAADLEGASQDMTEAAAMVEQLNVWAQEFINGMPAGMLASKYGEGFTIEAYDEDGELVSSTNYSGLIPELEAALAKAKAAAEAAEQAKDDNAYNIAKLAELQDVVDDIDAKIKEMHAAIGALGLTTAEFAQIPTETADEEFEALKAYLLDEEGNPTKYAGRQEYAFNVQKGTVLDAIADAYAEAEKVEKAYLQRLLTDIQADFNTKYEAGELENADELDALIAAQRDALADANLGVELQKDEDGNEIALTPAERMAALKAIEKALFGIGLGDITPNDDATNVVKGELDLQADGVDEAIKALADAVAELDELLDSEILAGWQHTPVVGADADGMAEELAAIIAAYEADNSVETKGSYYENLLNALLDKANTGLANVAEAKTTAENEIAKRELSNYWADAMDAEIAAVEAHYNTVLADMAEYKYAYNNAEYYLSRIGGDLETDEEGNVIGGGLIAMAKYCVAQAREEFSLNNNNTSWNEKWEAMYDENGNFVEWILVDPQESVQTSLYNLSNIYSTVNNFALYAAQIEVSGWRSEAWTEWRTANTAVNTGDHVDQTDLNNELWRIYYAYYTIRTDFSDVTEFARNLATAKEVIDDAQALAALAADNFFTPGDLDGNKKVTTADFVALIDIILENTEAPEEGTVEFAAADLNNDGEIGVGDAVKQMRIINRLDDVVAARMFGAAEEGENSLKVANGAVCLTNSVPAASMMLDIKGAAVSDIDLAARAQGMEMMTNTLKDGTLRVVIIATDGSTLDGNEGAVLNMAKGSVTKAVMADARGREYILVENGEVTAIEAITNAVKNVGTKIYNAGGQMLNGLKKGINIIINADGTSTKVIKK